MPSVCQNSFTCHRPFLHLPAKWEWRALRPQQVHSLEPLIRTSQMGSGVPQKREREIHQSRAPSSQLWKRLARTCSGTQYVSCEVSMCGAILKGWTVADPESKHFLHLVHQL